MRVLLVSANREKLPAPVVPLGVLAVAGAVRMFHDVQVVDLCFADDPVAALRQAVNGFQPNLVGIGIRNLHTNAYDGSEGLLDDYGAIVTAVRAVTTATVVLGGSGYSLQPERLRTRLGGDYGVVGEGERIFPWLVDELAAGRKPPAILRADAANGPLPSLTPLRTRGAPFSSDLDILPPPARDLIDPRYYATDGTDNVQTKRGCAFQCAYCDYPDLEGRKVRTRDPNAIADEVLARAAVPGVSHLFFVDSVFNVPRSHALAVCRALVDRGVPLPWVCYASPLPSLDDELVAAMAQAGCLGVEIGADAGTERMLKRLRKPFALHNITATHARLRRHGILDCQTFVLGALDETADEAAATLAFVEQLAPDVAVFIVFMEDREARTIHRARHRTAILELLAREAPKHPGWVVPELGIRLNEKLSLALQRSGRRGPSWLHLARRQRAAAG